jgi:hypothetical protein
MSKTSKRRGSAVLDTAEAAKKMQEEEMLKPVEIKKDLSTRKPSLKLQIIPGAESTPSQPNKKSVDRSKEDKTVTLSNLDSRSPLKSPQPKKEDGSPGLKKRKDKVIDKQSVSSTNS